MSARGNTGHLRALEAAAAAALEDGEPFAPTRHPRAAKNATAVRDQVRDLRTALVELSKAELEMEEVPDGLSKHEREKRMLEPMSRLSMVEAFIASILRKNGWAPR